MGQVTGVDATAAAGAPAALPEAHEGTRHRVARSILENGPSTAAALAERLDLTPAAVRRHLDTLLAEGLLEAREQRPYGPQRRGRGRPAKVFGLTDAGRDAFYQAYDELAVSVLRFLAAEAGTGAVERFARSRVAELEERYRPLLRDLPPAERPRVLAEALSADGYAATTRTLTSAGPAAEVTVTGEQLCQHHCPVAHVAGQFPQLCEAETEVFGRLLGTHVQRLATIAHGDGVCTTYIPTPIPTPPPQSGRQPDRGADTQTRPADTDPHRVTDNRHDPAPRRHPA